MVGQLSSQLIGLLRNSIIGHAVSPEDFGKAAVFALVISLVESVSEMSVDKFILQYKFGSNKKVISSIHFFYLIRGFICSTLIIFLHPVFLYFFDLSEAYWGLYLVALVPLIKGFTNVDFIKIQRSLNYLPLLKIDVGCQLAAFFVVYILLKYIPDYRAALFAILAQSIFYTIYSHIVSAQSYSVIYKKLFLVKFIKFGWPLLINGIGLFLIMQGDKFIISKIFGMSTLGYFTALGILALMPAVIISKVLMGGLLPVYSKGNYYNGMLIDNLPYIFSLIYLIYIFVFGDFTIKVVFGENYLKPDNVFVLFGIMWFFRLLQSKIVIIEVSKGNTKTPMIATIIRLLFVPVGFFLVFITRELYSIIIAGILGEVVSLLYLFNYKNRKQKLCHL